MRRGLEYSTPLYIFGNDADIINSCLHSGFHTRFPLEGGRPHQTFRRSTSMNHLGRGSSWCLVAGHMIADSYFTLPGGALSSLSRRLRKIPRPWGNLVEASYSRGLTEFDEIELRSGIASALRCFQEGLCSLPRRLQWVRLQWLKLPGRGYASQGPRVTRLYSNMPNHGIKEPPASGRSLYPGLLIHRSFHGQTDLKTKNSARRFLRRSVCPITTHTELSTYLQGHFLERGDLMCWHHRRH